MCYMWRVRCYMDITLRCFLFSKVSQYFSARVNSRDGRGILMSNTSGDYSRGKSLTSGLVQHRYSLSTGAISAQ